MLTPAAAVAIRDASALALAKAVTAGSTEAFSKLSPRELQVCALIADGLSTKEIAHRLMLSIKTIETHRCNMLGKLRFHSVAQVVKYAVLQGLSSLSPQDQPSND